MYTETNFPSKKALREAVARGDVVTVFQPGPFAATAPRDGTVALEGPHYPQPHRWYARAVIQGGRVVKVLA